MPLRVSTHKGLLLAAYSLLILVGVALTYLALRGAFSTVADVVLPFAYVGVISFLVRYQMRTLPSGQRPFSFRIGIRLGYLIKSLLCLVIAFVWTAVVSSITGDSRIGVALAVGPSLVIVGVGVYFFIRGYPTWFRQ